MLPWGKREGRPRFRFIAPQAPHRGPGVAKFAYYLAMIVSLG